MKFFQELQALLEDNSNRVEDFASTDPKEIANHLKAFFDESHQANKWADPRLRHFEFERCFGSAYEDDGYFGKDNPKLWEAGWREGWVMVNGVRIFFAYNITSDKLIADTRRIGPN